MWGVLLLTVPLILAAPAPMEAEQTLEFVNLPDNYDVNPAFLAPKPETIVTLPVEPKHLTITFGHHAKALKYFYSPEDTVLDVYKFVSERTKVPLAQIEELQHVTFNTIGRSFVTIPFSISLKLRDIPLIAGDELEVKFKSTVDVDAITILPPLAAGHTGSIPGFFDVEFKIAGFPQTTIPIPRLAAGSLVRTIVEDRFALVMFTVDLRRDVREGIALANGEVLSDKDNMFFGTLVERENVGEDGLFEDSCPWGVATVVTNLGKSHHYQYNCNTTAGDVLSTMDQLGLVPEQHNTPGAGILVSTKGFFHEEGVDTLKSTQTLVNAGIQENGMVFVTVACPVSLVYFQYMQSTFPQYVNCTSTIDYMTSMFYGILETAEATPQYFFYDDKGERKELTHGVPISQQLQGVTRKIVTIEYPHAPATPPATEPAAAPTPSPTPAVDGGIWDANEERFAPPPPGAVALGDGTLLQNAKQRWAAKH